MGDDKITFDDYAARNPAGPGDRAPFAEQVDDLQALYESLKSGDFYKDYDESSRLVGALRKHLEALPDMFHIIDQLAIDQSWEEKTRAEAFDSGITDDEELEEIMMEAEGDEDDDFLLDRNASLNDLTEMARDVAMRIGSPKNPVISDDPSPSV